MGEDSPVGKFFLDEDIEAEGLGRESCGAVDALKALDFSENLGGIAAVFYIPGYRFWWSLVVSALFVGTEGGMKHSDNSFL